MKLIFVLTTLSLLSCRAASPAAPDSELEAAASANQLAQTAVLVGAPELVFDVDTTRPGGNLPNIADSGFFTLKLSDGWIRGYSANGVTAVFEGPKLNPLYRPQTGPALVSSGNEFEVCGTWLFSAYIEPNGITRGWYHAESDCDYKIGQSHHVIAYASSKSKGLKFGDSSEERGEILTSSVQPTAGKITGNGGGSVIRFGNYFYAYFDDQTDPDRWHTGIARSPYSAGGKPGTWKKLYRRSFNEPGVGGSSDPNPTIAGIIAMANLSEKVVLGVGYASPGLDFAWSTDAINFTRGQDPLVLADRNEWSNRNEDSGELFAYPSLIANDGGRLLGTNFWLYYTYLPPGGDFEHPLIVRRPIQIQPLTKTDRDAPQVRIVLTNYIHPTTQQQQTSSGFVPAPFKPKVALGFLASRSYPGTKALIECAAKIGNAPILITPDAQCPNGTRRIRPAGWIWTKNQTNRAALYRCRNRDGKSEYLDRNQTCVSGKSGVLLGYIGVNAG